jgi:hypothetical protein
MQHMPSGHLTHVGCKHVIHGGPANQHRIEYEVAKSQFDCIRQQATVIAVMRVKPLHA